jgi:hypothetical protein
MKLKLQTYQKEVLLAEAKTFVQCEMENGREIPAPDRIDHRQRQSLICWFCRNHPEVLEDNWSLNLSCFACGRPCKSTKRGNNVVRVVTSGRESVNEPNCLEWDDCDWEQRIWTE